VCANRCCRPSRRDEPIQAGIIDDTGFPKKGSHSVGVARQYCGQLGKQDNCQVAVSLSVATHQGSLPVAYRLYLPKEWADDAARRAIAGVPDEVGFQTKPEIALRQLRQALAEGVPPAPVLMDPAYGNDSKLRAGISGLGLTYVAGIMSTTMVWRPGEAPLPAASRSGRGRPGTRLRRDETPPAGRGQDTGSRASHRCLADNHLARRQQHATNLAVCPMAGPPGA
jgi:SRSO17 transposase